MAAAYLMVILAFYCSYNYRPQKRNFSYHDKRKECVEWSSGIYLWKVFWLVWSSEENIFLRLALTLWYIYISFSVPPRSVEIQLLAEWICARFLQSSALLLQLCIDFFFILVLLNMVQKNEGCCCSFFSSSKGELFVILITFLGDKTIL